MAIMANSRVPRVIGAILRMLGTLVVIAVCGLVIWRMCSSGDPSSVKTLTPNERLADVWEADGGNTVFRYQLRDSNQMITSAEYNRGYFAVTQCVFIPDAEQVQLVFRYNKSTLAHLREDYGLDADPDPSGDYYDVTLLKVTDLTPGDDTDNTDPDRLAEERIYPTGDAIREETKLYCYRRYVFDNVTVDDVTLGVFADIYYLGDLDYESRPYGTLPLCEAGTPWRDYRVTAADRRALNEFSSITK